MGERQGGKKKFSPEKKKNWLLDCSVILMAQLIQILTEVPFLTGVDFGPKEEEEEKEVWPQTHINTKPQNTEEPFIGPRRAEARQLKWKLS